MAALFLDLLEAFEFTELLSWIAIFSAMLFICNLAGGILYGIIFAHSKQVKPLPLSQRISFRLFMISELMLLFFILYYHALMLGDITVSHVIYWFSAIIALPLLGVIGSQVMQVVFSGKIKAKEKAYKRKRKAQREKQAAAETSKS